MSDSQVTTLEEAPALATTKTTKAKVAKPSAEGAKFFNVLIHPTGDETSSSVVEVSVEGFLTRIPRGVSCRVSESILHVLQNAVVTTYKKMGDDVQEFNTPRFPFSATPA
jgi:hypothetical protein